jgi:hypothetical protein
MYCVDCGSSLPMSSPSCSHCGRKLPNQTYPAAPTRNEIRAGTSSSPSHSVANGLGRLVYEFNHASRAGKFLIVLACLLLIYIVVHSYPNQVAAPPVQQQSSLSAAQQTDSPKTQANEKPEKAAVAASKDAEQEAQTATEQKKPEGLTIGAHHRIAFATLVQEVYQSEGRRIGVAATGKDFDTLELSSALIMEGTSTLDAAREIYGANTSKKARELKFKRIIIKGTESGYSEFLPL